MSADLVRLGIEVDSRSAVAATKALDGLGDQAATTGKQVDQLGKETTQAGAEVERAAVFSHR